MNAPTALPDAQSRIGIIWAYRFDAEGVPSLIDRDSVPDVAPGAGFVWIHLDLVHSRAKDWITQQPWLPAAAEDMFVSTETHQRLDHSAGLVWGVSHDLVRDVAADSDRVGPLYWIVGERLLLTGRREALQSIRLAADALSRGETVESPVLLFELIIEYIIDDVARAVVRLMDETDDVEDQVLADSFDDAPARVGAVRRMAVRLHRQLGGLHLLFRRFSETNSGRKSPDEVKAAAARLLQRIDGLHHDVQSVQDRARLLQGRDVGAHGKPDQPPALRPLDPDGAVHAGDLHHRPVRHQCEGPALDGARSRRALRRADLPQRRAADARDAAPSRGDRRVRRGVRSPSAPMPNPLRTPAR
jgi:zinc transporter